MALGFKIADGYVEVHAVVDDVRVRNTARRAGNSFGDEMNRVTRKKGEEASRGWFSRFFHALFDTKPLLSRLLPGWFEAFASPITFAGFMLGLAFVSSFLGAVLSSGLPVALGGLFIGLAAFVLRENELIRAEFDKTAKFIGESLRRASAPMIGPIAGALRMFREGMAQAEPILTRIMAILAPVVEPMARAISGFLINFLQGIEKAGPAIAEIMLAFASELPDFGKRIGEFFMFLAANKDTIITGMRTVLTVIEIALTVFAFLLVFLTESFNASALAWNTMTGGIRTGVNWLKENVPAAFHAVVDAVKGAWNGLTNFFKGLWEEITGVFRGAGDGLSSTFQTAWDKFLGVLNAALEPLKAAWESFWATFGGLFKSALGFMIATADFFAATIQFTFSWLWTAIQDTWNAFWGTFSGLFKAAWEEVSSFFQTIWNLILGFIKSIWASIGDDIMRGVDTVTGLVRGAWNTVVDLTRGLWNTVKALIVTSVSNAWNSARETFNTMLRFISGLYTGMKDAAKRMIQGVVDGISDMIDKVTGQISRLTKIIRDHLPGSPIKMGPLSGDHSPEHGGRKISEMIAAGLLAGVPSVKAALNAVVTPVAAPDDDFRRPPDDGFGPGSGGMTINIKGVWDFADPAAADKIVGKIHEAIENYKRGYGKK